jgi:surface protein
MANSPWGGKNWKPSGVPKKQPRINQSIEELMKPLGEKSWKGNVWGSAIMNVPESTSGPQPTPSVTPTTTVTPTPSSSPALLPFIMTIDTTQSGSASNTFVLPCDGSGYNATINWGDGNSETITGTPGNVTHVYATSGTYNVSISGTFPTIFFTNGGDKAKVMNIVQWGSIVWSTWYLSFLGCNNLVITATDAPNLSNVTNCYGTFGLCTSLTNDPMNHWDMSNVEVMWAMFVASSNFNSNISNWDVSSVTNFLAMFESCNVFNQNIGSWNVSSATNMDQMFNSAGSFNQDLSHWCVTNIPTEPSNFGGNFSSGYKPVWGTCPPPPSQTPTPTPTSSVTPTQTVTPTVTPTSSVTPTVTPTMTPTVTPTPSPVPLSFRQTDTSVATIGSCSIYGNANSVSRRLATIDGTFGTSAMNSDIPGGNTPRNAFLFKLNVPSGTNWNSGSWTWRLNIASQTTGGMYLDSVYICRVNSSDVVQSTIASATGLNISLGSFGVVSGSLTGTSESPSTGDYVSVIYVIRNTAGSTQGIGNLPDQIINSPFI